MGILLATKNDRDSTSKNHCSMDFKSKLEKSLKIHINIIIKCPRPTKVSVRAQEFRPLKSKNI